MIHAVHSELTPDISAENLILALKRFETILFRLEELLERILQ